MEPINQKERSKTILSFLGVFLLSILPICLGVYLFARVDNVENKHLRSVVKTQQSTAQESQEVEQLEKELSIEIGELNDFLDARTQVVSPLLFNEIQDKVSDISKLSADLNDELKGADRKKYVGLIIDLKKSLSKFNVIYSMVSNEFQLLQKDLDDKDEKIKKLTEKLEEAKAY